MINLQDLLDEKRSERFNNLLSVIKDETRKTQFNNFLAYLVDNTDYFNAPASPAYHCSWPHGLVDHSMNVAENALKLNKCLNAGCNEEELVIGSICHDLGKAIIDEHEPYYLVKEATPNQKKYGYVAFPMFEYNKADQNFMTVPLRAVRLLTQFVDISDDLFMAILTHDGQYVPENSPFACKECKMQLILHYADSWAGFQMEDRTVQTPSGKGYDIKHDTKEGKNGSKVRQSQTQGLRDLFK